MRLFATANTFKFVFLPIRAADEPAGAAFLTGVSRVHLDHCKALCLGMARQRTFEHARTHPPHETVHLPAQRAFLRTEIQGFDDHRMRLTKGQGLLDRTIDFAGDPGTHARHEIAVPSRQRQSFFTRALQSFRDRLQTFIPTVQLDVETLAKDGALRRGNQIDHPGIQPEDVIGVRFRTLRSLLEHAAHLDVPTPFFLHQAEGCCLRPACGVGVCISPHRQLDAFTTVQCRNPQPMLHAVDAAGLRIGPVRRELVDLHGEVVEARALESLQVRMQVPCQQCARPFIQMGNLRFAFGIEEYLLLLRIRNPPQLHSVEP